MKVSLLDFIDGSVAEFTLFQSTAIDTAPSSPTVLEIKEIPVVMACQLNKKWHSKLPIINWSNVVRNTHYVCYGAKYEGRYYAVGIWSSPVAQNRFTNGKEILELRRLAICDSSPKNTASRMISVMIKMIKIKFSDIKRLVSYQDTSVHTGGIYKASNWKMATETEFMSWADSKRKRNADQSTASKIRWEYYI